MPSFEFYIPFLFGMFTGIVLAFVAVIVINVVSPRKRLPDA